MLIFLPKFFIEFRFTHLGEIYIKGAAYKEIDKKLPRNGVE